MTGNPYSLARDKTLGVRLPAAWDYLARTATPAGRAITTASTLARGSLYEEPGRPEMGVGEKASYFTTGGKKFPFDRSRSAFYKQLPLRKQLGAAKAEMNRALKNGDLETAQFYHEQYMKLIREKAKNATLGV